MASVLSILKWLLSLFVGPERIRPADEDHATSTPAPDIKIVEPVVHAPTAAYRWYRTPELLALLKFTRKHEGGADDAKAYNADYAMDDRWFLVDLSFDMVRALGRSQVTTGGKVGKKEPSSAIGAYQFLTATLDSLKASLGLTGSEMFDEMLQDDLAVALMIRRGLLSCVRGEIGIDAFCNNLAKEWASLPVVTAIKGASRQLTPGQSYYAGDGLNKAFHKPADFRAVVVAAIQSLKPLAPKG